ncbi:hypothetical protein CA54_23280 [Symmachiella macrocystis]|uniref:Uncharacterized protein n=1 Tax=Symmachiella macrocystis TaxID=2527985 RepID=A0A5C6BMW9_9PLAN|nr:hypothetical protein CA54_23280 [Symmachiella macrocystis]
MEPLEDIGRDFADSARTPGGLCSWKVTLLESNTAWLLRMKAALGTSVSGNYTLQ